MTRSLILNIILLIVVCCGIGLQRTNFFSLAASEPIRAEGQERYAPAEKACSHEISEAHEHDVCSQSREAEALAASNFKKVRRLNDRSMIESAYFNIISPPPESTT